MLFRSEVLSQELEEMHHELSKDGENHKLGDVKNIPTEPKHSRFAHSNSCFSINTHYRINLERLLFVFVLIFCFVRPPLYHLYMRMLREIWVEISWMLLWYWEKGCLS